MSRVSELSAVSYDVSREQEGCWEYHSKLSSDRQHQLITIDSLLQDLDLPAMKRSIEMLIRRHESLRTYFPLTDGPLKQCVVPYDAGLFAPECHDLSDAVDPRAEIGERLDEVRSRLRRLDEPPLIKCCLFKVPGNSYYISVLMHHIIADSWSESIALRELSLFYEHFRTGGSILPDALPMQLKDYALWQKKWLQENGDSVRDYWAKKLGRVRESLDINDLHDHCAFLSNRPPDDGLRSAIRSDRDLTAILNDPVAGSYTFEIGEEQFQRLTDLSASCKASIVAVLNAGLQLLFYFLTGRDKILIAMPVINRFLPGTESIIGCLGGAAYLHQPITDDMTVTQLVESTYLDFLESTMRLIYTYEEMDLDGKILRLHCDAFVNYTTQAILPRDGAPTGDRQHQVLKGDNAYYALSCYLAERPRSVACNWKHNMQLYPVKTIELMVDMFMQILQLMCEGPGVPIERLRTRMGENYNIQ